MNIYIWIPVDNDIDSKITTMIDAKFWALVKFRDGVFENPVFYRSREEAHVDFVDYVVLKNRYENILDFLNDGTMALCVRDEESLEDIYQAFKFKELDEIGF